MKKTIIVIAALAFAAAAQENTQTASSASAAGTSATPIAAEAVQGGGMSTGNDAVSDTAAVAAPAWDTDVTVVESNDADTVIILGAEPTDTQAVIVFEPVGDSGTIANIESVTDAVLVEREEYVVMEPVGSSDTRFSYFSVRQEFQGVFEEVTTAGLRLEFGMINERSGLLLTGDFGGGANYLGGGLNVGYLLTNNKLRYALGFSCGYHNTELVANFISESGRYVARRVGHNAAFAGAFVKLMPWAANHFDITARVMLGYKNDSARYDRIKETIYTKDGISAAWSISAGYVLLKRSEN